MAIVKSRKFQAAIAGIVAIVAGKLGLGLDAETCGMIAAIVVAYITGQAISDHGVASAQIQASTKTTTVATGTPRETTVVVETQPTGGSSRSGEIGHARLAVVALLAALGLALSTGFALDGCHGQKRDAIVATTLAAVNESRDGFVALDRRVQADIVDHATSLDEGRAELARWRDRREVVLQAFEAVYRALAIAATEPSQQNVDELLAAAAAFRAVYDAATKEHSP